MRLHGNIFQRIRAFTLIELLVVISIIGILAGLLIPAGIAVTRRAKIKMTQAQLRQITSWIDGYKARRGHYPPENPANPSLPPLVYELTGTTLSNNLYVTTLGSQYSSAVLKQVFGVGGIANTTVMGAAGDDDTEEARNFASNLDPSYTAQYSNSVLIARDMHVDILVSPLPSPHPITLPSGTKLNPWNYALPPHATHNPSSYDLWIDLKLGSKLYRICNWSDNPVKL